MQKTFLGASIGHAVALSGAILLHAGIGTWAIAPSDPIVIPQQQVIQIAMVALSSVAQVEVQEEVKEIKEVTKAPPADEGMKRAVEKKEKLKKKVEKKKEAKKQAASVKRQTTGKQSLDATLTKAAITEPTFNADYLKNPAPHYPKSARKHNIQGKVLLEVVVSPKGDAQHVTIASSSGFPILDRAAENAVKRWHFVPARSGSKMVQASVLVPIEFKLN